MITSKYIYTFPANRISLGKKCAPERSTFLTRKRKEGEKRSQNNGMSSKRTHKSFKEPFFAQKLEFTKLERQKKKPRKTLKMLPPHPPPLCSFQLLKGDG